jgi:hypothetical protein
MVTVTVDCVGVPVEVLGKFTCSPFTANVLAMMKKMRSMKMMSDSADIAGSTCTLFLLPKFMG